MRRQLQKRRRAQTLTFTVKGQYGRQDRDYTANLGYYPNERGTYEPSGPLAEVFITSGKVGSDLSIATTELSVVTSLALQHGVSLEALRKSLPQTDTGVAEGALGALIDLIIKHELQDVQEELLR